MAVISLVGVDVKLSGIDDENQFLRYILEGRETLKHVEPRQALAEFALEQRELVQSRHVFDQIYSFDADSFSIPKAEATLLDPQHRLLLLLCRSVLFKAGVNFRETPTIGVFATCDESESSLSGGDSRLQTDRSPIEHLRQYLHSDRDFAATRVAYQLGLNGPAFSIQSACSSSLVALHLARQAITEGDCEYALVAGVTLRDSHNLPYLYHPDMVYSNDGHCRPFDARANGTNLANGGAAILLCDSSLAKQRRHRVIATIEATGVNNDGRDKMSFAAPSLTAQANLLERTIRKSKVTVDSIQFVEAHGTGTKLGDPIEFRALSRAFESLGAKAGACGITGAKANFGHLGYASGLIGLIKAALCIEKGIYPGLTNYSSPSPFITLDRSPFYIDVRPRQLASVGRACLVTALGVGGTNACALIRAEESTSDFEKSAKPAPRQMPAVLMVSDDSSTAAVRNAESIAQALESGHLTPEDAMVALDALKDFGNSRAAIVLPGTGAPVVIKQLAERKKNPKLCFVLPGQGSAISIDCKELCEAYPVFRAAFERCTNAFGTYKGTPVNDFCLQRLPLPAERREYLYVSQATNFSVQVGLLSLLESLGITPDCIVGHSFGEFVGLFISGGLTLAECVDLIGVRADCMDSACDGGMVLVNGLSRVEAKAIADQVGVYVAAFNGPTTFVFSGQRGVLDELRAKLRGQRIACRELSNPVPYHCDLVKQSLLPARERLAHLKTQTLKTRIISTVTAKQLTPSDVQSMGDYVICHGMQPVLFEDALKQASLECSVFLEIGSVTSSVFMNDYGAVAFPLLQPGENRSVSSLLGSLSQLWMLGFNQLSLEQGNLENGRRSLPSYRYSLQSYAPVKASPPIGDLAKTRFESSTVEERSLDDRGSVGWVEKLLLSKISAQALNEEKSFFAHGGTSLDALSVVDDLESEGIKISIAEFYSCDCMRELIALAYSRAKTRAESDQ